MAKEKDLSSILGTVITGSAGVVVLSSTEEVQVKVCSGETLPLLLKFGAKISRDLGLSLKDADGIRDKLLAKVDDVSFILDLIADYAIDVYSLVGSMTSLGSMQAVEQLPVDDLVKVIMRVVEVNTDFFMTRVLPLLKGVKVG